MYFMNLKDLKHLKILRAFYALVILIIFKLLRALSYLTIFRAFNPTSMSKFVIANMKSNQFQLSQKYIVTPSPAIFKNASTTNTYIKTSLNVSISS